MNEHGPYLSTILENNPTGIIIVERNTRQILYVNNAAAQMIGIPKEEIENKVCHKFICPSEMHRCPVSDLGQTLDRSERILIRGDGTEIPILKTVVPIAINGKDCLLESFIDISDHKKANENLRQSEERYRAIFENTGNASMITDETRIILLANSNFEKLSGYAKEELEGKISWTQFIDEQDLPRMMGYNQMRMNGTGGAPDTYEFRFITRKGDKRDIFLSVTGIPGTKVSIASCMDITERRHAEEALKQSEEKFSKVFKASQAAIAITRLNDGLIVDTNDAFQNLLKYSPEELIGKTTKEMNIWAVEADRDQLLKWLEKGPVRDAEVRFRTKDGDAVICRYSAELLSIAGEAFILSLLVDITEQKLAEEALRKSEKYFKALTENATDVLFIVDKAGTIKYVTPSIEWVAGYTPDELLGKSAFDLIFPDDLPRAMTDFDQALRTKDIPIFNAFRIRRKDGTVILMEGTGKNLLHDPVIAGFIMNVRDITENNWAVEALRENEKKFRSIVENAFDCILIIDLQGIIRFVNDATIKTIKADDADDLVGKNVAEFIAPESIEDIFRDFVEVASGHDAYLAQYYLLTKQSERICVESIGKLINYEGQMATIVSIRDVTERNRVQEEKAKLQDQLLQAQKMESIGRLAGGVAHDFNNMLGVIRGHAEMAILKIEADHPVKAHLRQVIEAAERSANLTRQLLAFARKQTIAPKVLDLNDTVSGMLKLLRRLIGEDITLAWLPGPDLWPIKIDPSQVDQILANLCVNARDAINNVGKATIETKNISLDETFCYDHVGCVPGDYVMLTVSDNGSGMDKETQAKIFEPFFTTKGVGKGTGLGLATVYGIIKQNNGFINVYSEPGTGTTFRIYLPRHAEPADREQAETVEKPTAGGDETVLVVEDEPTLLELTKLMLETKGFHVLVAGTPDAAIRLAGEYTGKIHLLLTDVVLPGMNGRDLADAMRTRIPDLKCLFMSGYTADVIAHHGILNEGVHFIEKPLSIDGLVMKIRELLD